MPPLFVKRSRRSTGRGAKVGRVHRSGYQRATCRGENLLRTCSLGSTHRGGHKQFASSAQGEHCRAVTGGVRADINVADRLQDSPDESV